MIREKNSTNSSFILYSQITPADENPVLESTLVDQATSQNVPPKPTLSVIEPPLTLLGPESIENDARFDSRNPTVLNENQEESGETNTIHTRRTYNREMFTQPPNLSAFNLTPEHTSTTSPVPSEKSQKYQKQGYQDHRDLNSPNTQIPNM